MFPDSRGSTHAFHAFERVGIAKILGRVRIQEGNASKIHGSWVAVGLDFGGEGSVVRRYYTSNKTRPLLGEQGLPE